MINKAIDDLQQDPEKLVKVLLAIRETEERLTDAETAYDEARKACRDTKKTMDGIRHELRRVTKYGPDPQQGLPFVEAGEEQPGELDADSAAAAASYNKKKAKAVENTKKRGAKKNAGQPF